jgi:phage shock protein PspC (stress-responsive transcriptional regulator)
MTSASCAVNGVAATLDELGKPAWIALLVLAFVLFWPLGLALLAYLIWSGRMKCSTHGRWRDRMHRWRERDAGPINSAFDDYREETLKRLEEEEREFRAFLDRLRRAKDKAEFDEFMAARKRGPEQPMGGAPGAA